ncbi:MAG: MoaD/ThiS family protein [Desulfobacterota bacterium]|nr:MoaD/ThiS family protein [Thermodesulfobacteriota bacterium]
MQKTITIELKLFMFLKKYLPAGATEGKARYEIEEGATIKDLLERLGIPIEEDKIIVINGISHKQSDKTNAIRLKQDDVVAIFPPIAGG